VNTASNVNSTEAACYLYEVLRDKLTHICWWHIHSRQLSNIT